MAYPENLMSARGALPFLAAAALVRPEPFLADRYLLRFLEPTLLTDGDVRSLSDKVRLEVDPEFDHNLETAWPMQFEAPVTSTPRGGQQQHGRGRGRTRGGQCG